MTPVPDLSAYEPADATEQRHVEAMVELARQPTSTRRDHFEPGHFTASAFVLSPDRSRVVLIEHSKFLRWLQPGGHIEPTDRDVLAACRREVAEEVGLTELVLLHEGPFDVDVHAIPARKGEPAHQHFDMRFLFQSTSDTLCAGSDALAAKWVSLDDVDTLPSDESVYRAVRKIRAIV